MKRPPRGLPDEIVARLSAAVSEAYSSGAVDKYLASPEKMPGTPTELAQFLASDIVKTRACCRLFEATSLSSS